MKKINIGLDISIASVGWSITSAEPNDYKILDAGSRLFEEANSSNSKNSSTADRRGQRGRQRNLRRLKLKKKI
ncbi:hypothetical protein [Spiroplasma endosymbiont of Seladonia tumulorum]|uniref:hypothetical protein n=1 Tax=Spiroplasma endosymbiont of Seladonia tumulorum TaxID=3066321 RepID=UPI0030CBFEDC